MPEMLNHIAIPVSFPEDIQHFYIGILGFAEKYRFEIEEEVAFNLFGTGGKLNVAVIGFEELRIELFQTTDVILSGVAHICLNVRDAGHVCRLAADAGYKVVKIDRPSGMLAFIADKTGNLFEIKTQ